MIHHPWPPSPFTHAAALASRHPQGKALNLTLPKQNVRTIGQNRRCDRVIWAGLARRPRSRGAVGRRDVPTIVVEFPSSRLSDKRRDYEEKKTEYRDIGVREYWIIDRFRRTLTVHYWRGARYRKRVIHEADSYSTPLLPGFELRLSKLLAADQSPTQVKRLVFPRRPQAPPEPDERSIVFVRGG